MDQPFLPQAPQAPDGPPTPGLPQPPVEVAIGLLVRFSPGDPRILITRRPAGTVYADFWEFPGGKLHAGETPVQALLREFEEELGLAVTPGDALPPVEHVYAHGHVRLNPFLCTAPPDAHPQNLAVAEHRWVAPSELADYRFPEANGPIIAAVRQRLA